MLFTWDPTDLCIIFHWWHIRSTFTLLISLVAVAFLTAGYEIVRGISRKYENSSAEYQNSFPSESLNFPPTSVQSREAKVSCEGEEVDGQERSSLLWSGKGQGQQAKKIRLVKAALYAVQVFYSFFIM